MSSSCGRGSRARERTSETRARVSVLGLRGSAIVELVTEGHDPPLEASVGISAVVTLLADWGSPVEDSVRFIWDHL